MRLLFANRLTEATAAPLSGKGRRGIGLRPILSTAFYICRAVTLCSIVGYFAWSIYQNIHHAQAESLVESLRSSRCDEIPRLIESLEPYRQVAEPKLQEVFRTTISHKTRLFAAMVLLRTDHEKESIVYEGLMSSSAEDFPTNREILMKWASPVAISQQLWTEVLNHRNDPDRRFRAGAALAAFEDPDESPENWSAVSDFLATRLVAEIGVGVGDFQQWITAFRPARRVLSPGIYRIFSNPRRSEIDRYAAAMVLANFASEHSDQLVDLVSISNPREYAILIPKLKEIGQEGKDALLAEFHKTFVDGDSQEVRNEISKRRAHAAVTLLEFDVTQPLMDVLFATTDLTVSTYAEERLSTLGIYPEVIYRLMVHADSDLKAALLRSLGGMSIDRFSGDLRDSILRTVCQLFQNDPDPGVHSAAEWAMRNWNLNDRLTVITANLVSPVPVKGRRWYVNRERQTMIVLKRNDMSLHQSVAASTSDLDAENMSPPTSADLAICSTEVTAEQYLKCFPHLVDSRETEFTPSMDCPIVFSSWHHAAAYCNWLSERDGIPENEWCYTRQARDANMDIPPQLQGRGDAESWEPHPDWVNRTGYRLLTNEEWEFACRAGSSTDYFWGSDRECSTRYARTILNSRGINSPAGTYCPNRYGLFDMHGNAAEWTHDLDRSVGRRSRLASTALAADERSDFINQAFHVVRGGSSVDLIDHLRAGYRSDSRAREAASARIGFRIARTIPSGSATNP